MKISLQALNDMSHEDALAAFMQCCYASGWAQAMTNARPYHSKHQLLDFAADHWPQAPESEKLQAFAAHPRIGDIDAIRDKFSRHTRAEQGQVLDTAPEVIQQLKILNDEYEQRFGFIFIVFASGKSATEMCELLKGRIDNDRHQEIVNAAKEQGKIMQLRLANLIETEEN